MKQLLRKFISLAAVMNMMIMTGCSAKKTDGLKDGTYQETVNGYGGEIEVNCIVTDGKLNSVKVVSEHETDALSASALKDVPARMVSNQSVNVDLSTGATVTSKAMQEAVLSAVKEAGGNEAEWQKDCTGKYADKTEERKATAVVVGGGLSGIAAVLRLRQNNINTTLIEKEDSIGGSLPYISTSVQITAGSQNLHTDNPVEITPDELKNDLFACSKETADRDLLNLLVNNVGTVTDWQVKDLGVLFSDNYEAVGYSHNAVRSYNTSSGVSLQELLTKEADVSGADIITNTAVMGLWKKNDRIEGVVAKNAKGTVIYVKADYIIFATGSGSSNQDVPYYGPIGNTNDIMTIAAENDLQSVDQQSSNLSSFGVEAQGETAYAYNAINEAMKDGAVLVNDKGEPFLNTEIRYEQAALEKEIEKQGPVYLVMKDTSWRTFRNLLVPDFSEKTQGSLKEESYSSLYQTEIEGVDTDTLKENIEKVHTSTMKEKLFSVSDDLYIVPLKRYEYAGLKGLVTDGSLHVKDASGQALGNVYSIGLANGGVFGKGMKTGAGTAWGFVSGYMAAEEITNTEKTLEKSVSSSQ